MCVSIYCSVYMDGRLQVFFPSLVFLDLDISFPLAEQYLFIINVCILINKPHTYRNTNKQ